MVARVINDVQQRDLLEAFLREQKFPFTIEITKGKRRSVKQNRLQRQWVNEIAEQRGDVTPEWVRGECKLTHGVPILRAENEMFCEKYDEVIKPLPYESKVALMMEPIDLPVTRLMSVDQKTRYLDAIYQYWTESGFILTDPETFGGGTEKRS